MIFIMSDDGDSLREIIQNNSDYSIYISMDAENPSILKEGTASISRRSIYNAVSMRSYFEYALMVVIKKNSHRAFHTFKTKYLPLQDFLHQATPYFKELKLQAWK